MFCDCEAGKLLAEAHQIEEEAKRWVEHHEPAYNDGMYDWMVYGEEAGEKTLHAEYQAGQLRKKAAEIGAANPCSKCAGTGKWKEDGEPASPPTK